MSAIGCAMGYLAHLQQVEKRVDGVLIQGSYSPSDSDDKYRWFLPDLPQGVKTPVEQVFRSPENVVKFYRHYENIIRAKQAEFSILEKEAEALTTAISMDKDNYWREEKVFPALVLRHMGSGNDYFPDRNCTPEEFVIKLELVWCCNGFRYDTPDECVKGVVNEAIKRGINPLFLKQWS